MEKEPTSLKGSNTCKGEDRGGILDITRKNAIVFKVICIIKAKIGLD